MLQIKSIVLTVCIGALLLLLGGCGLLPKAPDRGSVSSDFMFVPGSDDEVLSSYQRLVDRGTKATWCALVSININSKAVHWYEPLPGYCVTGGVLSPDGEKIAFTAHRDGDDSWTHQLVMMEADGSRLQFLTNDEDYTQMYRGGLAFSPNGKKLAYRTSAKYQRVGRKKTLEGFDIYEFDLDTGKERQITNVRAYSLTGPAYYGNDHTLIFSMNGFADILEKDGNIRNEDTSFPCARFRFREHLLISTEFSYHDGGKHVRYGTSDDLIFICDLNSKEDIKPLFYPIDDRYHGKVITSSGYRFGHPKIKSQGSMFFEGLHGKDIYFNGYSSKNWGSKKDFRGSVDIMLYQPDNDSMKVIVSSEDIDVQPVMKEYKPGYVLRLAVNGSRTQQLMKVFTKHKKTRKKEYFYFIEDMKTGQLEHFELIDLLYQSYLERTGQGG